MMSSPVSVFWHTSIETSDDPDQLL